MSTRNRAICLALAPLLLSSCATMDEKTQSAAVGAALGCAAGALLAQVTSNDPGTACAAGAVIGGLIGYQRARNNEIEEARKTAEATTTSVAGAKTTPVQTEVVQVTDKESGKTEPVNAFKSVSVDIPVSQLNTTEGREAMRKLNEYARKVATERGETVDMTVAVAPDKTGKTKVATQQTREAAGKGAVVRNVVADTRIPPNVQRVTIEVKNPSRISV